VDPLLTFRKTPRGLEISVGAIAAVLIIAVILALSGHLSDLPKVIPWLAR
jgi:hypothetical protein